MISESEARQQILAATPRGERVRAVLAAAVGHCLAEDLVAEVDLPGFDNSQMDGYAVRAEEAATGAKLTVVGEQAAGADLGLDIEANQRQAIRIFTGAPIPTGADAVIMQEDVRAVGDGGSDRRPPGVGEPIEVVEGVSKGEFVRRRGSDLCIGQRLAGVGERITPGLVGVFASQGLSSVPVFRAPRVVVVTTGDELRSPGEGESLDPGEIFNSNGPMLVALLEASGAQVEYFTHAPDDRTLTHRVLGDALDRADFVLVAGGVSVGDHDLVREALAELDVEHAFWRVKIKPGKPFLFGHRGKTLVFGLPGNPVSAYLTSLLFVLPALKKWVGAEVDPSHPALPRLRAVVREACVNDGNRPHYLRGQLDDNGDATGFRVVGVQQSHALFALSRAQALLRMEADETVAAGTEKLVYLLPGVEWLEARS